MFPFCTETIREFVNATHTDIAGLNNNNKISGAQAHIAQDFKNLSPVPMQKDTQEHTEVIQGLNLAEKLIGRFDQHQ